MCYFVLPCSKYSKPLNQGLGRAATPVTNGHRLLPQRGCQLQPLLLPTAPHSCPVLCASPSCSASPIKPRELLWWGTGFSITLVMSEPWGEPGSAQVSQTLQRDHLQLHLLQITTFSSGMSCSLSQAGLFLYGVGQSFPSLFSLHLLGCLPPLPGGREVVGLGWVELDWVGLLWGRVG